MFFRDLCQSVLQLVNGVAVELSVACVMLHLRKWMDEKH